MFTNLTEANERIEQLQRELDQAGNEQQKFAALSREKRVAALIHEKQCHLNHTDGCSWFYHDNTNPASWATDRKHQEYLEKAHVLLNVTDYDTATRVLGVL
jgi:hypothetical protein